MEKIAKPKLIFFQWNNKGVSKFVLLHRQQHIKCLSEFFEVIVINEDCDYQQICDKYQPDLTLFESGVNYRCCQRLDIKNTHTYAEIPKLGFHNGDSWCEARSGFLSDMEHWGIKTFFSICITTAEHTPEIAENLFVWPNFIDPDIYQDYAQTKVIPLLITGRQHPLYPWRERINKIVTQYYPSLICPHLGYDDERATSRMMYGKQYARTINSSWFVPTCGSVEKEVVRKHFEIPASKSCLITEKTLSVETAGFIDMQNCVFADESNILDKLDYLFQHLDKLESITNAGYQLVHSRHTLKQRDQIFQWFNLYKNLKSTQKIVQTNPFEPLTVAEKLPEIKNSHIIGNGLIIKLLGQGDEKLWFGQYEEAETLYLKCLNYISWMPEPKLRLTLCNLYKGKAETALSWIIQPIKYTLEDYQAIDPDPVEWAYFVISLLCGGKFNEAIIRANQFPSLCHPELDRTRWVINYLQSKGEKVSKPHSQLSKSRYSTHQIPYRSLADWIHHLCIMLESCQQLKFAERLTDLVSSEGQFSEEREKISRNRMQVLRNYLLSIRINWLKTLDDIFEILHIPNLKPSLPPISELEYIVRLARFAKLNFLKRLALKYLHHLKV